MSNQTFVAIGASAPQPQGQRCVEMRTSQAFRYLDDVLDRIPDYIPLIVNVCLAGFVFLAHGGALALACLTGANDMKDILPLASVTLPLAAIVGLSSILGFFQPRFRSPILASHAIVLCVGAVALLLWSTSLLFKGIPEGNFGWSPGMLTFFCVYPVYLLRRTLLAKFIHRSRAIRLAPLAVLIIAVTVDVGVFVRTISAFAARRDEWRHEVIEKTKGQHNQRLERTGVPPAAQP